MVVNRPRTSSAHECRTEPVWVRWTLITIAVLFLTVFVVLPLVVVFTEAFSRGAHAYLAALSEPEALSAIRLTLTVAAISVGLNLVFGVIAAWAIATPIKPSTATSAAATLFLNRFMNSPCGRFPEPALG